MSNFNSQKLNGIVADQVSIRLLGKKTNWQPVFGKGSCSFITDLYVALETVGAEGICYPGPLPIESNQSIESYAKKLRSLVSDKSKVDGIISLDDDFFRYKIINTIKGRFAAFRRMSNYIPNLKELCVHDAVESILSHKYLQSGGLVILSGETGQGKTTLAAAALKTRMEMYGTFCLTVEDPPELPLQGVHGKGFCIQSDADGNYAEALKGALRSYPAQSSSILFVGEVRDAESAAEALRASANGHLVFITMHGINTIWTLKRLALMASSSQTISETEALSLLSGAFRACIHSKIKQLPTGKATEVSIVTSKGSSSPAANRIRDGRMETLATIIEQQLNECERGNYASLFD